MRRAFQKIIRLHPEDTKKLVPIPIEIPTGTEALRIKFSYSPMEVDDLELGRNLMRAKVKSYAAACEGDPNIPPAVQAFWLQLAQDVDRFLPLRNLLNFSLYDPTGRFRGRWDSPQYFGRWAEMGPDLSQALSVVGSFSANGLWNWKSMPCCPKRSAVLEVEILGADAPRWFAGEMHSIPTTAAAELPWLKYAKRGTQVGLYGAVR